MTTQEISQRGVELITCMLSDYGISWERGQKRLKSRIYSPSINSPAITILIKTTSGPVPGGGKGKLELNWWTREDRNEDFVALVDLSTERIWIFQSDELREYAQQHSRGMDHLYMRTDHSIRPYKITGKHLDVDFNEFLLERRIGNIFGKL